MQGRVVVLNEPQNILTRLVALERIGGYRVDQEARGNLRLIAQFGGTVGGFRSSVLKSLHGWAASVLVEDTDLTFRVYLAGYKIRYSVDAECYEQAVIIGSHIGDKGIGGQKVTCNVSLSIHGAF